MSGDGSTVIGYHSGGSIIGDPGFRWTAAEGRQDFPSTSPRGEPVGYYMPTTVNTNGSVILGNYEVIGISDRNWAFVWTRTGGYQTIEPPSTHTGGQYFLPNQVCGDGQRAIGTTSGRSDNYATLWQPDIGAVDLNTYLPQIGIDLGGFYLEYGYYISTDGTTIAGIGHYLNPDPNGPWVGGAWVITLPSPSAAAVLFGAVAGFSALRRR